MKKEYEASARTVEEAIEKGLQELGLSIGDVDVQVLEEGSKGLFGLFGSRTAKVRLTAKEIAASSPQARVGIMATDGTVKTGLYQEALRDEGLSFYTPRPDIQKEVMHQIYDCVKSGRPCDRESFALIEKEFTDNGCSLVILACTELSVIKADEDLPDMYVDPMLVLARKLIEFTGRRYK